VHWLNCDQGVRELAEAVNDTANPVLAVLFIK
jgi:hypothetical protein